MPSGDNLRVALQRALMGGAVAAAAAHSSGAQAQAAEPGATDLNEVVVTGTRIRRVDAETASPIVTVSAEAIKNSGVATLGDLIQQLPSIAGAATNPQVNNGGGGGESYIELRGLGAERTLVLLNGRRLGVLGQEYNAFDVNMIPVNMIERVEVLKEGAGAVYGSDAVGGVVNIITYSKLSEAEVSAQYGVTGKQDGKRSAFSLAWGTGDEHNNLLIGLNYNKQEKISAGNREFAKYALYLYNAAVYGVTKGGSSRTPTGRIFFPSSDLDPVTGDPLPGTLSAQYGCSSVTRKAGASGASQADYRCYSSSSDAYNYQPLNLILTPQERGNLFVLGSHEINDYVTLYGEVLYNRTQSGYQIAPLPFDTRSDNVVVSADSFYNPFGIDFGGIDAVNPNAVYRLEALGNRQNNVTTSASNIVTGLKGTIPSSSWAWDLALQYGREDQDRRYQGYLYQPPLAGAFGPSFQASDGKVYCGTAANGSAPPSGTQSCTPINLFNLTAPGQSAALQTINAPYADSYAFRSRQATLALNGTVLELPAGAMKGAFGVEYHDYSNSFDTDFLSQSQPPLFLNCLISGEACSSSSRGEFNVKEFYGELFAPLLKDLPGIHSLNVTVGTRYSKYSTFGNTTNSSIKLEYRPIRDVLVRASFAEVFRAPTLYNLTHGPAKSSETFNDPCTGLTAADLAANPNLSAACVNVPTNGTFENTTSQVDSVRLSNRALKPETGHVLNWGVVFEPSWLPSLSMSVDMWSYKLDDVITELDTNYTAEQCVATNSPAFCDLIFRNASDGTILEIQQPVVNLGKLKTDGVDVSVKYRLPSTPVGDFNVALDTTYIAKYESTAAPGATPIDVAGTYDRQFGNFARWRGVLSAGWKLSDLEALVSARYIHSLKLLDPDGFPGIQPDLQIPSIIYWNLMVGYTLPTNTKIRFGMDNVFDKQPPIFYQNNVTNANTDVETYDTIGRRWNVSVTQKF